MSGRVAGRGVFERSIDGLLGIVTQTLYAETSAARRGFLQLRDARAKLLSALAILIASASAHDARVVAVILTVTIGAAAISRVGASALVRALFVPLTLISVSLAIPALFVTPGNVVLQLEEGVAITDAGVRSATLLVVRVFAAAAVGLTLVLTTSWPSLLAALRALRLPAVIVMLLGMTYRYVFLLLRISHDMFVARRSRTVGGAPRDARKVVTDSAGVLLAKAIDESERVFLAMTSRGFDGEVRLLTPPRLAMGDWAMMLIVFACSAAAVALGRTW